MTGYGNTVVDFDNKKIHVELKALNSKAFDLNVRIAPLYREREMEIRQILSRELERGKVDFSIWIEKNDQQLATPINTDVVASYYRQICEVSEKIGLDRPSLSPAEWMPALLRLPDTMTSVEVEVLSDEEWEAARAAIDEALRNLVSFRKQEGEALQKKFIEKLDNIANLLASIEPYEKSRVEKIRGRIVEGLSSIPEVDYDKNRLEQELIYYIEKLDISEEKQRLANHLKYFRETMDEGDAQGKKLGFIAQEMGREINTTGSKSNQAEMQNIVVMMKDELEQIEEQVLNAL